MTYSHSSAYVRSHTLSSLSSSSLRVSVISQDGRKRCTAFTACWLMDKDVDKLLWRYHKGPSLLRMSQRIEEKEAWLCGFCRFTNRRINDQRMRKAADELCRATLKRDICVGVMRINCFTSRSTCRQLPYLYLPDFQNLPCSAKA